MTTANILNLCRHVRPNLIYFAVGPAHNLHQQYPPQIHSWPGKKLCILIDPLFEETLKIFEELNVRPDENGVATFGEETVFVCCREQYMSNGPLEELLHALCDYCLHNPTQMIAQDYCGGMTICSNTFPIERFGPALKDVVLFDMNYGDDDVSTCFMTFDKVRILMTPIGRFIHPGLERLADLRSIVPAKLIRHEMKRRSSRVLTHAHRFYCVEKGLKEPRDWCTIEEAVDAMNLPCRIYGLPVDSSLAGIRRLLWELYVDFCGTAAETPIAEAAFDDTFMNTRGDEFDAFMRSLRNKIPEAPIENGNES